MADTEMSFIKILWILLLGNSVFGKSLPMGCEISDLTVVCEGKNVTKLPVNIPEFATQLYIKNANLGTLDKSEGTNIGQLSSLVIQDSEVVNISENFFHANNDENNGDRSHLKVIFLNQNKLEDLSSGLFQSLSNLKDLSIADNNIQAINGAFKGLGSLQKLHLQGNRIKEIDFMDFYDLVNLTYLDLSHNKLGYIDAGFMFANNLKLTELLLNGINMHYRDVSLSSSNLTLLSINDCLLQGIPLDLPVSLTTLHLNKNELTDINKGDLGKLKNLFKLYLADNSIQFIPHGIFEDFKHLHTLDLSGNRLEIIPGPFPNSISHIKLEKNYINTMETDHFYWKGPYMFHIELGNNNITEVTDNLFRKNIEVLSLDLSGNPITKLERGTFLSAKFIFHLVLSHLQLMEIQDDAFLGLDNLSMFSMRSVQVPEDKVADDIFKHVDPYSLDLSESPVLANNFVQGLIENKRTVPRLKHLFLQDNNLTTLTSDLQPYLPAVDQIKIAGNHFNCTKDLIWLQRWFLIKPYIFIDIDTIDCHLPESLEGTPLIALLHSDILSILPDILPTSLVKYPPHIDQHNIDNLPDTFYDYNFTYDENYDFSIFTDNPYDHVTFPDMPTTSEQQIQTDLTTVEPDIITTTTNTESGQNVKTTVNVDTDNITINMVQTTEYILISTEATQNNIKKPLGPKHHNNDHDDRAISMKSVGIAIGMSFGVILIMLLITLIVFKIFLKRPAIPEVNGHTAVSLDYVSVRPKADKPEPKVHRKLSRAERGSTTSHASEDITNHIDMDMKVYTLDMDD
ncbi:Leucine-rich repeat transmembrane protein flrt1 [Mactra antiquata]